MEKFNGTRTFNPRNRAAWRKWLTSNTSQDPVFVVIFHKNSKTPNVTYADTVEEALCFGWIDNRAMKRDAESMYLRFAPRKATGSWSLLNRTRAEKLIKAGMMTPAGQVFIDIAKKSGKWKAAASNNFIPPDLQKAFDKNKKAFKNFQAFPPFSQRLTIAWILDAKRPETRELRIKKTVELAAKNVRAKP